MQRYEHVHRLGCLMVALLFVAHRHSYAVVGPGAFNSMGLTLIRRGFLPVFFFF